MASIGSRPDIESKIKVISERIVVGKLAKDNKQVAWFLTYKNISTAVSALGGAGISHPFLSIVSGGASVDSYTKYFQGVPLLIFALGGLIFLLLIMLKQFYMGEEVEKKAIQALSLYEAFVRLETDFRAKLQTKEPLEQLNVEHEAALILQKNNTTVIPSVDDHVKEIDLYTQNIISKYCAYWNNAVPESERRER